MENGALARLFRFEIFQFFVYIYATMSILRNVHLRQKLAVSLVIIVFTIGTLALPSVDGVTKRIKFARGKSSATVSNSVIRGDQDTYIVGARGGQRMTVKVTSLENNAAFQIEYPHGEYLEGAGEMDDATNVTVLLPDSGDYRIIVGGTRGNATYRLTVSIK